MKNRGTGPTHSELAPKEPGGNYPGKVHICAMKTLETVYTPRLLPLYDLTGTCVVVIDILRATSSMCVAFDTGIERILPVSTPEECALFKDFDFLTAAERNAEKLPGYDLGNSPFEFQNPLLKGRKLAFTTTNGTKAIKQARQQGAAEIVIGSFLNITALQQHLQNQNRPVVLLCAGWKDKYNLEDTLFAGALAYRLLNNFSTTDDATLAAMDLYMQHSNDLEGLVRKSSHAQRFKLLHRGTDDVHFCLQQDYTALVPKLEGEYLVAQRTQGEGGRAGSL